MVLLALIMFMGGLFLAEMLGDFIRDESNDLRQREWVYRYYGTGSRAVYTLFEITLAGCWPTYLRPLIEDVSPAYIMFTAVYITVVVFAVIRIITALFLKETLQVASNDEYMMVSEQMKKKQTLLKKLERVFTEIDVEGTGKITLEHLTRVMNN
jgi:hypothetical protein